MPRGHFFDTIQMATAARQGGYCGFECSGCGRDYRVARNYRTRPCCKRSLDEARFAPQLQAVRDREEIMRIQHVPSPASTAFLEFHNALLRDICRGMGMQSRPRPKPMCTLSTGVQMEADLREIEHPEGRLRRNDGTRFDILCMDIHYGPDTRPPPIYHSSFHTFDGERYATRHDKISIGRKTRGGIALVNR
jgi:hypothetical protein